VKAEESSGSGVWVSSVMVAPSGRGITYEGAGPLSGCRPV
jgi:hypothetical protein